MNPSYPDAIGTEWVSDLAMELHFLIRHISILCASYRHWTGKYLMDPSLVGEAALHWLDDAPFALVSHGTQADPVFNYANRTALELFGMSWAEFTSMPSRLSAGPVQRSERARLLERVARDGYIDDYAGIRIAKGGRRFLIRNATVWNLRDADGGYYGQAALIPEWEDCSNA
jgi:hypothetical protein